MNNLKTDTNIKIPIGFICFGLISFVVAQLIIFINSNELLIGQFRIPQIWMSAHILVLGFAVMVAMGAAYQLVPVVFLTPIWNQTFGFIQFFVIAVGISAFALMLGFRTNVAYHGAALLVLGILMFLFQMAMTLRKLEKKIAMSKFMIAALVFLLLTILAGFLLAINLAYGSLFNHIPMLFSHMTFGLAGWFTLLIMTMSYKLVPMFSLSHSFSMNGSKPAFYFYVGGMVVVIFSYWTGNEGILAVGFFSLLLGFFYFFLDMREILTKRMKKKLDRPFSFAVLAILNGFILHILAFLLALSGFRSAEVWSWLIYLYLMSWIVFSILGYLYKIIPFLWWTHKYSEKVGKEKVPTLKEMMNEKLGTICFVGFAISIVGILISVALQSGPLLYTFFGLQTIASIVYSLSIFVVLFK